MIDTQLRLPDLELKPQRRGLTMVIDPGLFTGQFEDAIDSVGEFVDLVKFGWGTCLVTKDIEEDFAAGARLVTAEARESGRSRICRSDGQPRHELVNEIIGSGIELDRLLFEAPSNELQTYFLRRMGPRANLGNVRADDVIALETLRRGLRSDTLPGAP